MSTEHDNFPSIMGGMKLADNECLVALDEAGTGWIIARSDAYRDKDVLMECSAEDCGFNSGWDKGLSVGVYLVTLKPWADQSWDGDWDGGVDVIDVKPMWTVDADGGAA